MILHVAHMHYYSHYGVGSPCQRTMAARLAIPLGPSRRCGASGTVIDSVAVEEVAPDESVLIMS
jgi:hypothetical protein